LFSHFLADLIPYHILPYDLDEDDENWIIYINQQLQQQFLEKQQQQTFLSNQNQQQGEDNNENIEEKEKTNDVNYNYVIDDLFLEICFNFFERISLSRDFNLKV
jgi:hypothetical protein